MIKIFFSVLIGITILVCSFKIGFEYGISVGFGRCVMNDSNSKWIVRYRSKTCFSKDCDETIHLKRKFDMLEFNHKESQ